MVWADCASLFGAGCTCGGILPVKCHSGPRCLPLWAHRTLSPLVQNATIGLWLGSWGRAQIGMECRLDRRQRCLMQSAWCWLRLVSTMQAALSLLPPPASCGRVKDGFIPWRQQSCPPQADKCLFTPPSRWVLGVERPAGKHMLSWHTNAQGRVSHRQLERRPDIDFYNLSPFPLFAAASYT